MNHALLPSVVNATLPQKYEAAKLALVECKRIDECKDWADKSQALASYARQSQDKQMEKTAMRIRARAIRRCGVLLREVEKSKNQHDSANGSAGVGGGTGRIATAARAGMSRRQAVTAIRVAGVNGAAFEEQVESETPPTVTALAEQGKKKQNGVPIYEQLGMTEEEFQAGMYFRGDMESYLKATRKHAIKDVVRGSTPDEISKIKENIAKIEAHHQKLLNKL